MLTKKKQKVAIVMGSQSDYATMQYCKKVLKLLKIGSNGGSFQQIIKILGLYI